MFWEASQDSLFLPFKVLVCPVTLRVTGHRSVLGNSHERQTDMLVHDHGKDQCGASIYDAGRVKRNNEPMLILFS